MDLDHVAGQFKALAYPTRLKILRDLQAPRSIGELDVTTIEDGRERTMTREGVRHHITQLVDAGLVASISREPRGRNKLTYQVRPAGLFHLSETLVHMANPTTNPSDDPADATTGGRGKDGANEEGSPWPSLAIVNGLGRGDVCELGPRRSNPSSGWVIGSDPGCDVVLPYDENVANRHAEILPTEDGVALVDFRSSGPTHVNWVPLERGAQEDLVPGDVIGVGSTLLVLQNKQRSMTVPNAP